MVSLSRVEGYDIIQMVVFRSIFSIGMGLHYLTFIGRNVENRKKVMLVQINSTAIMNSKNIVNNVSKCNGFDAMNNILLNDKLG